MAISLSANSYTADAMFTGVKIAGNDPRMRFRNSQDPIYVAYECLDNQPISSLAKIFVKDQIKGFIKFVSKITK